MHENECLKDISDGESMCRCTDCSKELDLIASSLSSEPDDDIYICFESIKQKIFVYGRYTGGRYGALRISKYFTKEECSEKVCDDYIRDELKRLGEEEYSRFTYCSRGNMDADILTKKIISIRKSNLSAGRLNDYFRYTDNEKKYFCRNDSEKRNYICSCGEKLIKLNSEEYREMTGMNDSEFAERFFPAVLELK